MTDLKCIITKPKPPHQHTHTAIFLHGRGDNADNFSASLLFSRTRSGETVFSALPTFRWVFPSSEMRPATSDGGAKSWSQWFDIFNFQEFSEREEEVAGPGLRGSVASVLKIVNKEVEVLGGKSERIVLLGISQGAAVGMHVLLNITARQDADEMRQEDVDRRRLGAFIGFSAWLPYVGRSLADMRKAMSLKESVDDNEIVLWKNTPIMLEHSADDRTVDISHGVAARDALVGFETQVEWKEYSHGGHWFKAPEGIEDAIAFIKAHVPGIEDGEEKS